MKKVFTTPQGFFLLLAVLILIVGFSKDGSKLDLNYFLSFLLVDVWSVAMVSSLFFVLISINYASLSLIGKKAKTGLTIAHIVLQIIALVPLIYFMVNATAGAQPEKVMNTNIILLISFVVFMISIIIHLINFFYSLLRKNNS